MGTVVAKEAISTIVDKVTDSSGADKAADAVKGNLQLLSVVAQKQRKLFEKELISFYKDKGNFGKYKVVGNRLMGMTSVATAQIQKGGNRNLKHGIQSGIDGLFGEGAARNDNFHQCVSGLVGGLFDGLLGDQAASETFEQKFIIIPHGFTVWRIDIFMWKMNVNAKAGLYETAQSSVVTVAGKGVVDHTILKDDELIALAQQVVGTDPQKLLGWVKNYTDVIKAIQRLKVSTKELQLGPLGNSKRSNRLSVVDQKDDSDEDELDQDY